MRGRGSCSVQIACLWLAGPNSGLKLCSLVEELFGPHPSADSFFPKTLYLATAIWAILDHSYSGFLAARILMGFASGAAETIAPVTISDLFFLHERGSIMALYTSFLSVGVGFGMIIAG